MARTMGLEVLHGEAAPSGHAPMELWRGVHRSLGLEPSRDPSLPAEEQRWDHLESLADALAAHVASSRDHEPGMPPLDALCGVSRVVVLGGST